MRKPEVLHIRPSVLVSWLGGLVATLLLAALLNLAPLFGFPFVDFPGLIGGVFSANGDIAFGLGYLLLFLGGIFVYPTLLILFWYSLPGGEVGFVNAVIKGAIWGVIVWLLSGLLLPLLAALNQQPVENPGFFALNAGLLAPVGILLGHIAYGIAVALLAAMPQGINFLDSLGWPGYRHAQAREMDLFENGRRA